MANSIFNLSDLNGSNGFVLNGINANDISGVSVSSAGDINNDGIDDLIIGAPGADPNGNSDAGQSYVVFGSSNSFSASFELSSLNGSNGFILNGIAENDNSGDSVSAAGDINGDGIDDLIIGAPGADRNSQNFAAGQSYVVFGSSNGFSANLELSSLNGSNGFALNSDAPELSGFSVSGAGDINNDGIDDLIIGAPGANPNGNSDAGQSYVVFGSINGFNASFELSSLNGSNGFVLNGINASDSSGWSVSDAGDINNDGIDDLIIGAWRAESNGNVTGKSYVVFGSSNGFSANLELSSLDGSNGFVLNGINASDFSGWSVSDAGDINGDGIDDLIIGAHFADPNGNNSAGQSYVVFGSSNGFNASLELSSLDGSNGFVLNGINADDRSGWEVSSAGDINGDGIDDLIIGARGADPNGNSSAGQSYVVFGSSNGFSASLELSSLDGSNGFVLNGIAVDDNSGRPVSSAGDINGDGIDDLIIGASGADPNGNSSAGQSYVVFGNRAPELDLNGGNAGIDFTTAFFGTAVSVTDNNLSLNDNSNNVVGATVTITNLQDGAAESLSANTTGTNITATYNSATGVLALSGTDTVANYQQVFQSITYNNTAATPNATDRMIEFVVDDGAAHSNTSQVATTNIVLSVDDAYEENDTIFTAYNLSNQEQIWLSNIAGLGLQADQDWYRIDVTPGFENLVVDLQFNHALGDLDLGVYDTSGNLVASSISSTDNESINTILSGSGTYYLLVDGYPGDTLNTYDLRWDDLPVDDAYEENDTIFTAYDLSNQEQTWLSNIAGLGLQADQDWYRIDVTPGFENLVVDLQFNHAFGNLDLGVYDASGNLVASSISTTDNESINTILSGSGTYYLLVDGYPGDTLNTYDLRWDDLPVDDAYEENDTIFTAYNLSNQEQTWLSNIAGLGLQADQDWYRIDVTPGFENLVVDLQFNHAFGNLDLGVYDASGNLVASSISSTDDESINTILPGSGTYYLLVNGFPGNTLNTYDLRWDDVLVDDAYEENDTLATAYDFSNQEQTWLSNIAGLGRQIDQDWYRIDVTPGYENLVVDLQFNHAFGNLDLGVYDASGNLVTSSNSTTDNESINTILSGSGTYYLLVNGFPGNTLNTYDLRWDDVLVDDAYEENDTLATAYDLSNQEQTWLSNIAGLGRQIDQDWYRIDVTPGYENLVVDLQFDHALGDLDLFVYDASGNLVTSSNSTTDNELINTILSGSGTYYLLVNGFPGNTLNTYDLRWDDRLYLLGTDDNDTLTGTSNHDIIIGLRGDDDIFGGSGNDFLQGDRGDDNIFGEAGNDNLQGNRGDDYLFGGTENDNLDGDRGDDLLVGVELNATNPGNGEIDIMTGSFGADVFVIGDENQAYYDDQGVGDYTLITDFDSTQDFIQLQGSASNYQLGSVSANLPSGIGIFRQTSTPNDLIAIVQGTANLNLNADYFSYVS